MRQITVESALGQKLVALPGQAVLCDEDGRVLGFFSSRFAMIKAEFGDCVRSKTDTATRNEMPGKIACHYVHCLISAIHERGIDPVVWEAS
jgi:hypothetical protein